MSKGLLIVDIQNDYFPGGKMEVVGSSDAGAKAQLLLARFRERGAPVIHMQHVSVRPGATFFLPGTEGVEIHASVAPLPGEVVLQKNFPNSFRQTSLLDHFQGRGIDQLVIAGMMTHMCIDATARAAFDLGFTCFVAHDACATRDLSFGGTTVPAAQVHASFLAALQGIYAKVQSADELAAG